MAPSREPTAPTAVRRQHTGTLIACFITTDTQHSWVAHSTADRLTHPHSTAAWITHRTQHSQPRSTARLTALPKHTHSTALRAGSRHSQSRAFRRDTADQRDAAVALLQEAAAAALCRCRSPARPQPPLFSKMPPPPSLRQPRPPLLPLSRKTPPQPAAALHSGCSSVQYGALTGTRTKDRRRSSALALSSDLEEFSSQFGSVRTWPVRFSKTGRPGRTREEPARKIPSSLAGYQ